MNERQILMYTILICLIHRTSSHYRFDKRYMYDKARITEWPRLCKEGRNQSPIAIKSEKTYRMAMPALEMVGFHNLLPRPIEATNNGNSVEIKSLIHGYAKIFGALLEGEYEVISIHFHWGGSNNKGSEHQINKVNFPMEMHIVTKKKHSNSEEEPTVNDNEFAVMAFFFHLREKGNPALQPILDELEFLYPDGSITFLARSFTLASLLPSDTEVFYTYRGSFTTPPCSESVTWIIYPDTLPISYYQLSKFRSMSNGMSPLVNNFRPPQPLHNRRVFVRKNPTEQRNSHNIYYNLSSPEFWGTCKPSSEC